MSDEKSLEQQLIEAQQALIRAQEQVIELQARVDKQRQAEPDVEGWRWHLHAGMFAEQAATSDDYKVVRKYYDWLLDFGEMYIQPYVHNLVYNEIMEHMVRGVERRMAELEVRAEYGIEDIEQDITVPFEEDDTTSETSTDDTPATSPSQSSLFPDD